MRFLRILWLLFLILSAVVQAQQKFTVKAVTGKDWKSQYYLVDDKGKTVKKLDTARYTMCLSGFRPGYFAVFGIKGVKGWAAIDINEKILFKVYNTSFGEPSPDELREGKIRIVDASGKIGFANYLGKVVIKPQFEIASSFHKGKALIGRKCKMVPWDKHPDEKSACHHYDIVCKEQGYINSEGKVELIGNFTYEQMKKRIKWKSEYE
ncbi:WG repeat-containing protein [Desertivirga arenae]|uniref:WG repeat-containing protein n=1 Tax=Desertivirga arenae TaxID=2810309 RepID=UPI001A956BF6|nr:WG repeat-containing protein [Pedobacter sp. SYSU D00823]